MIFTISPNSESTEACDTKIGLTKVRREERPAFEGGEREREREEKKHKNRKKKTQTDRWYQEGKALEYSRFKSLWKGSGNTTLRAVNYKKKAFVFKKKKVYDCMIV